MATIDDLVSYVLDGAPAELRNKCDKESILNRLADTGCCDMETLRCTLEHDYEEVKRAIGGAAPPAFVALLKAAKLPSSRASCVYFIPFVNILYDAFFDATPPSIDNLQTALNLIGLLSALMLTTVMSTVSGVSYDDITKFLERTNSTGV